MESQPATILTIPHTVRNLETFLVGMLINKRNNNLTMCTSTLDELEMILRIGFLNHLIL